MHGGSFDSDLLLAADYADTGPAPIAAASAHAAGFVPQQQPQFTPPQPAQPTQAAGWYPDPWQAARVRWFDGRTWTGYTAP